MKKEDIFSTVLELIAKQGLHATPMAQVAKEANVAAGTIYHYFSGKEEMIRELYLSIRTEMTSVINAEQIDIRNYETEFSALCLRVFKFLIQNPLKFRFLMQYENSPETIGSELNAGNIEFPIDEAFFQTGLQNNLLKALPVSLMSNITFKNMAAMAQLHLAGKIVLNKELIQTVVDGSWNMIRK